MARLSKDAPAVEPAGDDVFEHDTCLYRGKDGEEARVFKAGEAVPPKADGWRDHPRKD